MYHSLWSRCAQKLMLVGVLVGVLAICLADHSTNGEETIDGANVDADFVSQPKDGPRFDRPRDNPPRDNPPRESPPRDHRPHQDGPHQHDGPNEKWHRAPQHGAPQHPHPHQHDGPQNADQQLDRLERKLDMLVQEVAKLRQELRGPDHGPHPNSHHHGPQTQPQRFEHPPHGGQPQNPRARDHDQNRPRRKHFEPEFQPRPRANRGAWDDVPQKEKLRET